MAILIYENLRTIAYTPFYLAIARGEWAREGLQVETRLSPLPTETAEGLMAGRVDVSWGGPMRVMMHHDRDPECSLVCFGQIVARDPFILVGRELNERFCFKDLIGKRIAIAQEVPTPWMTFQDDLCRAGIDPASLNRTEDSLMIDNLKRLASGDVDVVQVFEPYATMAVDNGAHIWHRFSERGDIGYTSFYTTQGFLTEQRKTCVGLLRGIERALTALYAQPIEETVEAVSVFFPDLAPTILSRAIEGYRESNLWAHLIDLPPAAVVRLKAALLSGNLIARDIPYDDFVDNSLETS